jgi:prevent-host-death family protein
MIVVGTREARTRLSRLIRQVERGESVMITRCGRPVARTVSSGDTGPEAPSGGGELLAAFLKFRSSIKRGGPSIRQLIDEGRD